MPEGRESSGRKRGLLSLLLLLWRKLKAAVALALSPMLSPWYGSVGGGIGCTGGLIAVVLGVIIAALAVLYVVNHSASSADRGTPLASANASGSSSDSAQPVGNQVGGQPSTDNPPPYPTTSPQPQHSLVPSAAFNEEALKEERLRAIGSRNMAEYNRLVQLDLQLYVQNHVDPCASPYFPDGCAYASQTAQSNTSEARSDAGLSATSASNPFRGTPGSERTVLGPDGLPKQTRRYGPDGYPQVDTDWDHDHDQGTPHVHDWGRPVGGGPPTDADRGPGRSPKSGDPGIP